MTKFNYKEIASEALNKRENKSYTEQDVQEWRLKKEKEGNMLVKDMTSVQLLSALRYKMEVDQETIAKELRALKNTPLFNKNVKSEIQQQNDLEILKIMLNKIDPLFSELNQCWHVLQSLPEFMEQTQKINFLLETVWFIKENYKLFSENIGKHD